MAVIDVLHHVTFCILTFLPQHVHASTQNGGTSEECFRKVTYGINGLTCAFNHDLDSNRMVLRKRQKRIQVNWRFPQEIVSWHMWEIIVCVRDGFKKGILRSPNFMTFFLKLIYLRRHPDLYILVLCQLHYHNSSPTTLPKRNKHFSEIHCPECQAKE